MPEVRGFCSQRGTAVLRGVRVQRRAPVVNLHAYGVYLGGERCTLRFAEGCKPVVTALDKCHLVVHGVRMPPDETVLFVAKRQCVPAF